jgi:hypothetical protein
MQNYKKDSQGRYVREKYLKKKEKNKSSNRRWPFVKWTFINVQKSKMNFWMSIVFLKKVSLDVYKRPIHCTDIKRQVIHIKDADQWKRDDDHSQFKQAIKRLSKKNSDLLMDWKDRHPGVHRPDDRHNSQYLNMIIQ